jgi:hypothetical protein
MSMRGPTVHLLSALALLLLAGVYLGVAVLPDRPVEAAGPQLQVPALTPAPAEVAAAGEVDLRLSVEVRELGRLLPPPAPPPVRAVSALAPVAGIALVAGPGAARPDAARGRHLARVDLADGTSFYRAVELPGDGRSVELALGPSVALRGAVVDPQGRPVAGARVWAGGRGADGALRTAQSGEDGTFELDLPGGAGVPLTVTAAGLASRFHLVAATLGAEPVAVRLEAARELRVVLAARVDAPELGTVHLAPAGDDVAAKHYPFFLPAIEGPLRLDADGSCTVRDLPAEAAIAALVLHPGASARGLVRAVDDGAGAARAVVPAVAGPVLAGRVVDPDGRAVSHARVECRAAGADQAPRWRGWLLEDAVHAVGASLAVADADGRFALPWPAGADRGAVLTATAAGRCGVIAELRHPASAPAELVLPAAEDPGDGVPSVRVGLEPGRPFRARQDGGAWRDLAAGEAFEVALAGPALVDVRVVLEGDGAPRVVELTRRAVLGALPVVIER